MKKLILTLSLLCATTIAKAEEFEKYFENKTLRMDYIHAGNYNSESYYFERLLEEPYFAGSRKNLVDTNNFGNQYLKVFDTESGKLIYSKGFCVLFSEWADTQEAREISKAYKEAVVMPYPKNRVRIELHSRKSDGEFEKKFEHEVDPSSIYIEKYSCNLPVFEVQYSGNGANKVDVVLIPEGYDADEKDEFKAACSHFASEMFRFSPYKENAQKFNIRGVWSPSPEHGVTIPGEYEWRRTTVDAKFYTLESERYQMVDNFQKVRDIAANAPYDLIYIISNTQKYGGGAIYNFYGISSANNAQSSGEVFAHEFGHLLLGLADEYVGGVTVNEMYPEGVEPWEVNITRKIDFEKNKPIWSNLIDKSLPNPTPATAENGDKVGMYEGGGYLEKGIYRPWVNCMMNTLKDSEFCPVCSKGIEDMIDFICE
ncbi:MAG: M64 family metallopeptidase [Rikenellaceae bacterium]